VLKFQNSEAFVLADLPPSI